MLEFFMRIGSLFQARLRGAGWLPLQCAADFALMLFLFRTVVTFFGKSDRSWWLASSGTSEFAEEGLQIFATLSNIQVKHKVKHRR